MSEQAERRGRAVLDLRREQLRGAARAGPRAAPAAAAYDDAPRGGKRSHGVRNAGPRAQLLELGALRRGASRGFRVRRLLDNASHVLPRAFRVQFLGGDLQLFELCPHARKLLFRNAVGRRALRRGVEAAGQPRRAVRGADLLRFDVLRAVRVLRRRNGLRGTARGEVEAEEDSVVITKTTFPCTVS